MYIGKRYVLATMLASVAFSGCTAEPTPTVEALARAAQPLNYANAWTSAANMLSTRRFHAALALQDKRVLVIGKADDATKTAEWYDVKKDTWTALTVPNDFVVPDGECRPALAQLANGLVLVVARQTVWSFDLVLNEWKQYPLPISTCKPEAIALGDRALIWADSAAGDAYVYDAGNITATPPLPVPTQGAWNRAAMVRLDAPNEAKVLVTGGAGYNKSTILYDDTTQTWTPVGDMFFGRDDHAIALLPNGNVMVAGGNAAGPFVNDWSDTVEIFDIIKQQWAPTTRMLNYRDAGPTATRLASGFILVVGGSVSSTAELFDPGIHQWIALDDSKDARYLRHASTPLDDGRVLVTAGAFPNSTNRAAICDALAFAWEQLASFQGESRAFHTATKLDDGTMLVVGGQAPGMGQTLQEAWRYNPMVEESSGGFWAAADMPLAAHAHHTATKLDNGQVLVAGGTQGAFAELFDPSAKTNAWSTTGALPEGIAGATATLLKDGRVLHVGGFSTDGSSNAITAVYLYDPATKTWQPAEPLPEGVAGGIGHSSTLLADGSVLVVGGFADCPSKNTPATARMLASRYDPTTGTWSSAAAMNQARAFHSAVLLRDGRVLVTGGGGSAIRTPGGTNDTSKSCVDFAWTAVDTSTEVYEMTTNTWTSTGNMTEARTEHQTILLENDLVLVAGGRRASNGRTLASADVFDPFSETWSATARMQFARYGHTLTALDSGIVVVGGYQPFSHSSSGSRVERFPVAKQGAICTRDEQCKSNICSGGVCCDRSCDSPCLACSKAASNKKTLEDGICEDVSSCAPYACSLDTGVCGKTCTSVDECAAGFVCDPAGSCINPIPNASKLDETSCTAVSVDSQTSGWANLVLVACAYALRRRRSQRKS